MSISAGYLKQLITGDPVPPPPKPLKMFLEKTSLFVKRNDSTEAFNKATKTINFLNQLYQFLPPNVVKSYQGLDAEAFPTKQVVKDGKTQYVKDEEHYNNRVKRLDTPHVTYATDYQRAWWDTNDRWWYQDANNYSEPYSSTYYGGSHSFPNTFNKKMWMNLTSGLHPVEGAQSYFYHNISGSGGVHGKETWSSFTKHGEALTADRSQSTFQFLDSSYWTEINRILGSDQKELLKKSDFDTNSISSTDSWGVIGTKLKNRHQGYQQVAKDGGETHQLQIQNDEGKLVRDEANIIEETHEKYGDIVTPKDPAGATDNANEQLKHLKTKLKVRSDGFEGENNRDLLNYLSESDGEFYENASIYELIMSGAHIAWIKDAINGAKLTSTAFTEDIAKKFYYASAAVNESLNRYQLGFNNMLGPASLAPDDRKGWVDEEGTHKEYWSGTGDHRTMTDQYYADQKTYLETYWEKYKTNVLDKLHVLNKNIMGAIPYLGHIMDTTPQRLFHVLNPHTFESSSNGKDIGQYHFTYLDSDEYYDFALKSTIMAAYYLANHGDSIKGVGGTTFNTALDNFLGTGKESVFATVGATKNSYTSKDSYNQSVLNEYFGKAHGVDTTTVNGKRFLNPERARYLYQLAMLTYQESLKSGSVTDRKLAEYRFEKEGASTFWKSEIKDYLTHFGLTLDGETVKLKATNDVFGNSNKNLKSDLDWIKNNGTYKFKNELRWTPEIQKTVMNFIKKAPEKPPQQESHNKNPENYSNSTEWKTANPQPAQKYETIQKTKTDAYGNPVKDANGNDVTESVTQETTDSKNDRAAWDAMEKEWKQYDAAYTQYKKDIKTALENGDVNYEKLKKMSTETGLSQFTFMEADASTVTATDAQVIIAALSPMIQYVMGATHKFETIFSDEHAGWRVDGSKPNFYVDAYPFRQGAMDKTYDTRNEQKSVTWSVSRYKIPVSQLGDEYHVSNTDKSLGKAPNFEFFKQHTLSSKAIIKLRNRKGKSANVYNRNIQALNPNHAYYKEKRSAFWNFMVDATQVQDDRSFYISSIMRRNRFNMFQYQNNTFPLWEQGVDQRSKEREQSERYAREAAQKSQDKRK